MEDFGKAQCFFRIAFDKIAVQVKVLRIAPETKCLGSVLIYTVIGAAVQAAADIIDGNNGQNNIGRQLVFVRGNISHQNHAGINAIGLARMNTVIDENDILFSCLDGRDIEILIRGNQHQVQGKAGIGGARFQHFYEG